MLPWRYGGTEALVVRSNLHPVSINQERQSSLGGQSVAAARATLPGTGFGTWTLRIEAGDSVSTEIATAGAGDSVSTEIATAAAAGFRSPLVLPLGFLLGEAFLSSPPCKSWHFSPNLQVPAWKKVHCSWVLGLAEEDRSPLS